jgi:hypothetical protein
MKTCMFKPKENPSFNLKDNSDKLVLWHGDCIETSTIIIALIDLTHIYFKYFLTKYKPFFDIKFKNHQNKSLIKKYVYLLN